MGTYRTMNICDLGYDDFTVISPLVGDPKVLVVGKDSKYNTLQELLDAIKETWKDHNVPLRPWRKRTQSGTCIKRARL